MMCLFHDHAKLGSIPELASSNIEIDPVGAIESRRLLRMFPRNRFDSMNFASSKSNSSRVFNSVTGILPSDLISRSIALYSPLFSGIFTPPKSSRTSPCSGNGFLPASVTICIVADSAERAIVPPSFRQNALNLSEPYVIPCMMEASASPMIPSPTGRIDFVRRPIFSSGYEHASITKSR